MTQKEMTEIFGIMLLAYPNAEAFKGGIQKLVPTIQLWCSCLPDVDFWTGQQAVIKLCRECKFPPTIAEFKEKAEDIRSEIIGELTHSETVTDAEDLGKTVIEAFPESEMADEYRVLARRLTEICGLNK